MLGWGTLDQIADNLTLIGKALGADAKAAELASTITTRSAAVQRKYASIADKPSVPILSNQAYRPFLNDDGVITSDLVRRAGGVNAATALGVRQTMPVSTEHVIKSDPDAILLVDVTGKGMSSYASILNNPAVRNLTAVRNGRIHLFSAAETYGGGLGLLDGSRQDRRLAASVARTGRASGEEAAPRQIDQLRTWKVKETLPEDLTVEVPASVPVTRKVTV